jgi:hypothetical protein
MPGVLPKVLIDSLPVTAIDFQANGPAQNDQDPPAHQRAAEGHRRHVQGIDANSARFFPHWDQ